MSTTDRVIVEVEEGVAHVLLNRPEKRNGLDLPMFEQLIAAGESLSARSDVRAVVLSGAGPMFCAGLDFASFMIGGDAVAKALLERGEGQIANMAQRAAYVWIEVPVPVIAAVHGAAFGGGMQLSLAADIRIAAPTTRFSVMEMRWGLIPDMSITQTLPRLVRLDVARELIYTGRIVEAEEAAAIGLVTRLSEDPLSDARALARTIAGKNPHAIRAAKDLLTRCDDLDAGAALALETALQIPLLGSPNQLEAVQANFQKRDPVFADVDEPG